MPSAAIQRLIWPPVSAGAIRAFLVQLQSARRAARAAQLEPAHAGDVVGRVVGKARHVIADEHFVRAEVAVVHRHHRHFEQRIERLRRARLMDRAEAARSR